MLAIDTHRYIKDLKTAGVPEEQAEVHANTLKGLVESDLVTKSDLQQTESGVRSEFQQIESRLTSKLQQTESRLDQKIIEIQGEQKLVKWMVGLSIALNFAILLKLFVQ